MTETPLSPSPTVLNLSFLVNGQTADASDVATPFNNAKDAIDLARTQLAVSENDTHVGNLNDKLTVLTPLMKTILDASGNKKLQLSLSDELTLFEVFLTVLGKVPASGIDATGATSGHALVADGAGNAGWVAQAGGGAQPVDITVTAGETLAERDIVYIDPSDDLAYKLDSDALPLKVSKVIGIVNHSGGIVASATGTIRLIGEVAGFTGLTPYADVWASATAGGYTQTKPTLSVGGGQKALIRIGYAVSATAIMVMPPNIEFHKRESLLNNGTFTLTHLPDPLAYTRQVAAIAFGSEEGSVVSAYASSNRDDRFNLRGVSGAGGSVTINGTGSLWQIGHTGGTYYTVAQSFIPTANGQLTQFTFQLGANLGTPSGTITWQIRADNAGDPGTVLASGTVSPTPNAVNTIPVTDGPTLLTSTTYWLYLAPTSTQTSGNAWQWIVSNNTSIYANGNVKSAPDGVVWTNWANYDANCTFTLATLVSHDQLAQSFQLASPQTLDLVRLWLRKVGSPAGALTLRIETDAGGNPSGVLAHANATITVAESILTSGYGHVDFDFINNFDLSASTTYWLVLSTDRSASNTHYVEWGADKSSPAYAFGLLKGEAAASWSALSADAIFEVLAQGPTYQGACALDFWTFTHANLVVRFDDGVGNDATTKTTFKNTSGSTLDVTGIVRL